MASEDPQGVNGRRDEKIEIEEAMHVMSAAWHASQKPLGEGEFDAFSAPGVTLADWRQQSGSLEAILDVSVPLGGPAIFITALGPPENGKSLLLSKFVPWVPSLFRPAHTTKTITFYVPYPSRNISFYRISPAGIQRTVNHCPDVPVEFFSQTYDEAIVTFHKIVDKMETDGYFDLAVCLHFPWRPKCPAGHLGDETVSGNTSMTCSTSASSCTSPCTPHHLPPPPSNPMSPSSSSQTVPIPSSNSQRSPFDGDDVSRPKLLESESDPGFETKLLGSPPPNRNQIAISSSEELGIAIPIAIKETCHPAGFVFVDTPSIVLKVGDVASEKDKDLLDGLEMESQSDVHDKRQEYLKFFFKAYKSRFTVILPYKSIGDTERAIFEVFFEMPNALVNLETLPTFAFFLRCLTKKETAALGESEWRYHYFQLLQNDMNQTGIDVDSIENWDCVGFNLCPCGPFAQRFVQFAIKCAKNETKDHLHETGEVFVDGADSTSIRNSSARIMVSSGEYDGIVLDFTLTKAPKAGKESENVNNLQLTSSCSTIV